MRYYLGNIPLDSSQEKIAQKLKEDKVIRAYISVEGVNGKSSGGIISKQESDALHKMSDSLLIIGGKNLSPTTFALPETPFLSDLLAANQLSKAMETLRIQHAHFYSGSFTQSIRLLKSRGVKVSYTVPSHDRRLTIEEHLRLGMNYPWVHIRDNRLWNMYIGGVLEADLVIAPSVHSSNFLHSIGREQVEIIPHGIDKSDIPDKIAPLPKVFTAGYLGQVGPDKGLVYLFRAWKSLNFFPKKLLIAGSRTDQLAYLCQQEKPGDIELLGWVNTPSKLYDLCSVYVQPSVTEGFGIEILEAMAYGRPVIASKGAGAADIITDGVDGFTVPIRDPQSISERIKWFQTNPDQIHTMGKAAKSTSLKYTWDKIHVLYTRIWKTLGV